MNIRNIYVVNGSINEFGLYEKKLQYETFIAECHSENTVGYSYYAFLRYDKENDDTKVTNAIRIEELMSLIEDPSIDVRKLPQDKLNKYRSYFETILENIRSLDEGKKRVNL